MQRAEKALSRALASRVLPSHSLGVGNPLFRPAIFDASPVLALPVIDFAQGMNEGTYHFGTNSVQPSASDDMDAEAAEPARDSARDGRALVQDAGDTLAHGACEMGSSSSDRQGGDG